MRFIPNGPSIPDRLLSDRDAGRVVFLCGAGISVPSGMPSFIELTRYVIEQLNAPCNSAAWQSFLPWIDDGSKLPDSAKISLDQIFNLLQLEYGRNQIDRLVSERLAVPEEATGSSPEHQIISRISANADGIPQIVTTNFDRLFEHSCGSPGIDIYEPPTFPDLKHGVAATGLTYLHGRLSGNIQKQGDFVLSSSDFGRAYLAQGWATSFIRQLLESYTVVLVGYQAEDPPVKYLLQGLSSRHDRAKDKLYVFDQGISGEVEAKWVDRGATPIAYAPSNKHAALWETLDAWATRADAPRAWRSSVVNLAVQNKPSECEPHERGMVAHLLRSSIGAKEFANAVPSPAIEWLAVLDRNLRFAQPYESIVGTESKYDPLDDYCLDDDPSRPSEGSFENYYELEDLVAWRRGDDSLDHYQRLSQIFTRFHAPLPTRLFHIARWLMMNIAHPSLAWWVARQQTLHPRLITMFKIGVEDSKELPTEARQLWELLLEASEQSDIDEQNSEWFRVLKYIRSHPWTYGLVRSIERATEPRFKVSAPIGKYSAHFPEIDWSANKWDQIARIEVHFPPLHGDYPDIPAEWLPCVYSAIQRNLVKATERLVEARTAWISVGSPYPTNPDSEDHSLYIPEDEAYVHWFVALFDQMATVQPVVLRAHVDTWPASDEYIFNKLRLYAWNKKELFSGQEVAAKLIELPIEQFWDHDLRRELLFLLEGRWRDFSQPDRNRICERIFRGSTKYEFEDEKAYLRRRPHQSAIVLSWLVNKGCDIAKHHKEKLDELKSSIAEWDEGQVSDAASSSEPIAGFVRSDCESSILKRVPVGKIVDVVQENAGLSAAELVEKKPFVGLIREKPTVALAALVSKAKEEVYPPALWNELISNWPEPFSNSSSRLLFEWMRRLPSNVVFEIRWTLGDWFNTVFPNLATSEEAYALRVYDDLLENLLASGAMATQSGIGESRIRGRIIKRSRSTIGHAINSPIGKAADGLLTILESKELPENSGIPHQISQRAEVLLNVPGEGAWHATCLFSRQLPWLNFIDPCWVKKTFLPILLSNGPSSEPAWNGLLLNSWNRSIKLFPEIKESFLSLFPLMEEWLWDDSHKDHYFKWVVQASLLGGTDCPGLTFSEARDVIRSIDQVGRERMIGMLRRVGMELKGAWTEHVVQFVREAWPKELRYKTEGAARSWLSLLDDTGDSFPQVFDPVREHLCCIRSNNLSLFRFYRQLGESEPIAKKFPMEALELIDILTPNDSKNIPYDLAQVLNLLEEVEPSVSIDKRFLRLRDLEATI